jgi:hypothetical protein
VRPEDYYDVTPRIVPADRETLIEIRPLYEHVRFRNDAGYRVTCYPLEEYALRSGWPEGADVILRPTDGALRLSRYFENEQEHLLHVEEIVEGAADRTIGEFRIYSLTDDLYRRRPYKGDLHIHSYRSDGRESPGYVAAAARGIGLDFMAVTDHHLYAPSLEAQQAFDGVKIDLRIYPGEEVHPPGNPVHMINFGGRFSLNEMFSGNTYWAEVQALQDRLGPLSPGVDPYQYASCCWCFDRIRQAGGLGIFCHPYWFTQRRYAPSGALTGHLFQEQPYDAFELLGGYFTHEEDSNTLQVARYHDERARGRQIPIVGVSDAHGCERGELFGWFYTIVFAPSTDLPDLITSIKDLYSVAVAALPGETVRAYGPFRYVKYALFLLREALPLHDALCVEESRLMREHLAGDATAADRLADLSGRTAALLERCWGRVAS